MSRKKMMGLLVCLLGVLVGCGGESSSNNSSNDVGDNNAENHAANNAVDNNGQNNAANSDPNHGQNNHEVNNGQNNTGEVVLTGELQRVASPVLDPRSVPSPVTGEATMFGALDPCAVWDPKAELWRVYFSFADDVAESQGLERAGIAGATSVDGTSFTMNPNLALAQQGTFDVGSVETCEVIVMEDEESSTGQRFLMFYSASNLYTEDIEEIGEYVVALATSEDGVIFEPLEAELSRNRESGVLFGISEALGVEEVAGNFITDPTVTVKGDTLYMWTLCIQLNPEPFGGICHHTSQDGIQWEHLGFVSGLDRAFAIQPTVFYNPKTDLFEMYVVMDTNEEEARIHDIETNLTLRVTGFYHATSSDGLVWTYDPVQAFSEDTSLPWEDGGLATAADAEYRDGEVFFFYPSFTTQGGSIFANLLNWPLNLAKRQADE